MLKLDFVDRGAQIISNLRIYGHLSRKRKVFAPKRYLPTEKYLLVYNETRYALSRKWRAIITEEVIRGNGLAFVIAFFICRKAKK